MKVTPSEWSAYQRAWRLSHLESVRATQHRYYAKNGAAINAARRARTPKGPDDLARFWAKVEVRSPEECWPWLGARAGRVGEKYGQFRLEKRVVLAHRAAWMLQRGAIPAGLVIDHLCRTHLCVNLAHLEVVTPLENIRRGHAWRRAARSAA